MCYYNRIYEWKDGVNQESPPMGAYWSITSNTGEQNAVISETAFIVSEIPFLQIQHHGYHVWNLLAGYKSRWIMEDLSHATDGIMPSCGELEGAPSYKNASHMEAVAFIPYYTLLVVHKGYWQIKQCSLNTRYCVSHKYKL